MHDTIYKSHDNRDRIKIEEMRYKIQYIRYMKYGTGYKIQYLNCGK